MRLRRHRYRLYGGITLLAIAGLIALALAAFNQVLTPVAVVKVHLAQAGQQLLPGSDVKVRGIDVGTVSSITSTGNGAELDLHLRPDMLTSIPSNVTVRLVPKTLFGEKYVDFVLPRTPAATHLVAGSQISAAQTRPTLEIDQALNSLLPVLRAVRPEKLNQALSALAGALQGRGNQLGTTLTQLDTYLKGLNPQLPRLAHDLNALSAVSRTYDQAAGPLLQTLRNLTVTSTTVVDERTQIARLLSDLTASADTTRQLLAQNATNLVTINSVSLPVTRLLARYSPEFPCFLRGDAGLIPRIHDAVPKTPGLNHAAHVVVEFVPAFPIYRYPIDLPQFQDTRGPHCYGLPHPKLRLPVIHFKDGTQDDPRFAHQGEPGPLGGTPKAASPAFGGGAGMGDAGTAAEQKALDQLLAAILHMNANAVPSIADLLWGPLARGNGVRLR
jgi:phospholipid/cholesterol/gamma-HCH transport system substrate-binding protein